MPSYLSVLLLKLQFLSGLFEIDCMWLSIWLDLIGSFVFHGFIPLAFILYIFTDIKFYSPSDWTYVEAELKKRLGRKFLIYGRFISFIISFF